MSVMCTALVCGLCDMAVSDCHCGEWRSSEEQRDGDSDDSTRTMPELPPMRDETNSHWYLGVPRTEDIMALNNGATGLRFGQRRSRGLPQRDVSEWVRRQSKYTL